VSDALVSKKMERGERAEEISNDDPAAPKIGRWYWVTEDGDAEEGSAKKWFGCVTHVGSNYVEITTPSRSYERVHEDEFWERCEHEPDPERVVAFRVRRSDKTREWGNLAEFHAYKPGDFHQFFDDPRTHADYLEWAPFLLAAEEYHAGNRKAPPPLAPVLRRKTEDGA
jgi:hypothetical protein